MEPSFRLRLYLLTVLVLVGFGALLSRLYEFQIVDRDKFLRLVPGNRLVTVREPGIRGEITDRNGITLARNLREYEVAFNLDEIHDAYQAQHIDDPYIERISPRKGLLAKTSEKNINAIVQESTLSVLNDPELALYRPYSARELDIHYRTHGGLVPFSYRSDLSYSEFSKFAEHNLDLPGVSLGIRPKRDYPYGALASHVLGYLKQWEKGDVPESAMRKFNHYIGDDKGVAGVEASMDDVLRGLEGVRTIMKDEKGRTLRPVDIVDPGIGAKLRLTIDAPVQYLLENTLRYAGRAAGVIMDVNTGEILAMASIPDYNPNDFIPSVSQAKWDTYRTDSRLAPFTNRAISQFTPGSTMKVPTAVAGSLAGLGSRRFSCDGTVSYGRASIGCWIWNQSRGSHGSQTLAEAIQHSCNPYFNKLANTIGWEAMVEGCQLVGMGKKTGVELPSEDPGMLPGSRVWRATYPKLQMTAHETAQLSIGQGTSMATPLQMCAVAATIANGGKYYRPRIVKEAITQDGKIVVPDVPDLRVDLTKSGVPAEDIERIRLGMQLSTNKPGGTSGRVKLPNIIAASKSGTAQTSDDGRKSHNSWIMSFAPYDNPKYAICILVQNGGSGGGVCGPLVNLVYRGLFARDDKGVRLPLRPLAAFTGNTDRIEKILEIPAADIAAVEAGTMEPAAEAIAAVKATIPPPSDADEEVLGETGAEVGDAVPDLRVQPSTTVTPMPTITPEVDAEGSVIPRAVPVKEP